MRIVRFELSSGQGVAVLLPWLLAVAGLLFGLYGWHRPAPEPDLTLSRDSDEPKEMRALRVSLASSNAENQALRQELDRLLGTPGSKRIRAAGAPVVAEPEKDVDPAAAAHRREVSERLQDALSRWSTGSKADKAAAGRAVWEALALKDGAFSTLRDAYVNSSDPEARAVLAGSMFFSRSPEVRDFLADQALQEQDPMLRRVLLTQAAKYATPESAGRLESTFIDSLGSSDDPRLRVAAVQGLRYARGEGVAEALLNAASDPDEAVRLAAVDTLSARPELRDKLSEIISRDHSSHVREIGNCRLLIAQEAQRK